MAEPFAHLHVHTEYSLLDGYSRIKRLVNQTKALGMGHLAITDHGAMYGALDFYKACKAGGIHPLLGVETYLVKDYLDKSKIKRQPGDHEQQEKRYHHLLLLARNDTGYRNLMKLMSVANTDGMHGNKARIDKKLLEQYGEGLIATSSCLGGEIPQLLLKGDTEAAYATARWYRNTLGDGNFYLEVQDHHGYPEQFPVNQRLYTMSKDLGLPLLATNDLHYVEEGDAHAHETLLCVQTQDRLSNPKRFKFNSPEFFLRSPIQMQQLFPDLPDALLNTVRLAEQCEVDPFGNRATLPHVAIPPEYATLRDYLYALCEQGIRYRYGDISERIRRQFDYEMGIIVEKGFVPYFLVVADYVGWARSQGIRCLARGSAAGSLVAYSLGITNVDPLRYQLLFERFLNPARDDMPDIDMDFPDDRREEVIAYISNKYGHECVAQMATFMTMGAKGAVRDVARVLEERALGDRVAGLIKSDTLQEALQTGEIRDLYQNDTRARDLLDLAQKLEGAVRGSGVHAAGLLVANEPLVNFAPLQLREGRISTQYEHAYLEELGLVKYDILGLATLTTIDNALRFIKEARGEEINLEMLPLDPVPNDEKQNEKREKAFQLLAEGETTGIFQLEGVKMREYIRQLKPTCIEDVMAMVALYRPGPMESIPEFIDAKNGRKEVTYLHPRLSEWLAESYGVIVYQDQVLQIAVNLAGFSWGKVNKFRKALSKKIMHEVEGYRGDFIEGCVKNGVQEEVAAQLFTLILPFGGYGFNKAHAASYAVVAFYTAYLKANYTPEFMAAMLTTESQGAKATKKVPLAAAECKRMGVGVLGPDVNRSQADFFVEDGVVRFGLRAVRGVGSKLVDEIIRERSAGGPYTSLPNVYERLSSELSKGALETLVKVGALDGLGDRNRLLASIDHAIKWVDGERVAKQRGLLSLFDQDENVFSFTLKSQVQPLTNEQVLAWEKEHLLTYISGHPLDRYEVALSARCSHTTETVSEESNKQKVTLGGVIVELRRFTTRAGKTMLVAKLEDFLGTIDILVFSDVFDQSRDIWKEGAVVTIHGEVKADQEGKEASVICRKVEMLQHGSEGCTDVYRVLLTIRLSGTDLRSVSNDMIKVSKLGALLLEHPGRDQFEIVLDDVIVEMDDGQRCKARVTFDIKDNTVEYTNSLHRQVVALLGAASVEVHSIAYSVRCGVPA